MGLTGCPRPDIAIVGLGQIGCSIAKSDACAERFTVGFDSSDAACKYATDRTAVARIVDDYKVLGGSRTVIVASPPDTVVPTLALLAPFLLPDTVVSDCASSKSEIVRRVERELPEIRAQFVGGHPMAGNEGSGHESSDSHLFDGAPWILTPTDATSADAVGRLRQLIVSIGAHPLEMSPSHHDRHVALLSHLPHVLASVLVNESVALSHPTIGAGSWRDLTRVASSDSELWAQILISNRDAVAQCARTVSAELNSVADALDRSDGDAIRRLLDTARTAKVGASN